MYNYIAHIDYATRFIYVGLALAVIILVQRLALSANIIIGLIIAVILIYYLNEKDLALGNNYLDSMDKILVNPIFKSWRNRYLYRDSELLSFLDDNRALRAYNPSLFNKLIKHVDNFLRLGKDLDTKPPPQNYNLDYENMLEERTNILNAYHAFIYRIPHATATTSRYQKGMQRLGELLESNILYARRVVVQTNRDDGVNIYSKFPYRNHPEPRNKANRQYNYF